MRYDKSLASGLLAALLLVACGGGGGDGNQSPKIKFTSMVSFGDSLSDVGTYAVGGVAAVGGGKYTVNSVSAKNWTELLSSQLGLAAPCAAQTGLQGTPSGSPTLNFSVTVTNHSTCRNYAQGGSRITNLYGPGNVAVSVASGAPTPYIGQMTVPITTQIDNHLGVVTNFSGTELVTVMAGANDLFMQFSVFTALAAVDPGTPSTITNFSTYAQTFADWSGGDVSTVLGAGAGAQAAAATVMVTKMAAAGTALSDMVKTKIKGNGAKYVLVLNIPNVSKTPFAASLPSDDLRSVVSNMTTAFNNALQAGLAGTAGVRLGDAYTTNTDQLTYPAQYGISNAATPACTGVPTSLLCSAATTVVPDVSTYLFADSVHPTPYGYKLLAQEAAKHLVLAGWL